MSKLKALGLQNFTAFEKLWLDFSPGINVLIGINGTGMVLHHDSVTVFHHIL